MSNFKLDGRTIAIIALVVIAAVVFLPRLLGNNGAADSPLGGQGGQEANPRDTTVVDDGIELGQVVTASNVDRDGCPVDTTSTFNDNTPAVYVVAEDVDVTQGTEVFVRWYHDGEVYEESDPITADQDYQNTCLNFVLQADQINQLRTGNYEAEFIVNGNPADTVNFQIR
jgi:hypothetical protein